MATVMVLVLAACGGSDADSTPTPSLLPTSTASIPVASPQPGQVTVGELADRIAGGWMVATTMRLTASTTMDSATPAALASPTASLDYVVTTEIDGSGNKRITITALGFFITQVISIRGQIWVNGFYDAWNIPESAVGAPFADGWMAVDTSAADGDASFNQFVLTMLSNYPPPYSGLSDSARARVVESLGEVTVGDRTCTAYRIPASTETGQAYDIVLSLDARGLPCSNDTIAFGQTQSNVYEFDTPIEITPPSTTPSTSPVANE
ncbi:hypothetical protein BH09CHL1_BH09CHL1_09150 [soil metagenome]